MKPRKVGARFTNDDIAPDEKGLPTLNLDYDGKRDRWNGFDPAAYQAVIEEYTKVEEAKRQLKEDKLKHDILNMEGTSTREVTLGGMWCCILLMMTTNCKFENAMAN